MNTLEGHKKWVNSVSISNDNKYIVSGSEDKTIKIWDFKNCNCLNILEEHKKGDFKNSNCLNILEEHKKWDFKNCNCYIL